MTTTIVPLVSPRIWLCRANEGDDRNRTGVDGFAGRCVATPPRRQGASKPSEWIDVPEASRRARLSFGFSAGYRSLRGLLGNLSGLVSGAAATLPIITSTATNDEVIA